MCIDKEGALLVFDDAQTFGDGVGYLRFLRQVGGFHAEALCDLGRVHAGQRDSAIVSRLAHLSTGLSERACDNSVCLVVCYEVQHGNPVVDRRPQSAVRVVQGAVADESDYRRVRRGQLGTDRGANPVALRPTCGTDVHVVAGPVVASNHVLRHRELLRGHNSTTHTFEFSVERLDQRQGPYTAILSAD